MPALRGHHLICLQFFSGEGYDQEFIVNLKSVIALLESDQLEIHEGRDDICNKCPYMKNNTCRHSENADQEIRAMDRKALELLDLCVGNRVTWDSIAKKVPDIFSDWFRSYCNDCDWLTVCEKNAFFRKVRPVNS